MHIVPCSGSIRHCFQLHVHCIDPGFVWLIPSSSTRYCVVCSHLHAVYTLLSSWPKYFSFPPINSLISERDSPDDIQSASPMFLSRTDIEISTSDRMFPYRPFLLLMDSGEVAGGAGRQLSPPPSPPPSRPYKKGAKITIGARQRPSKWYGSRLIINDVV